MAPRATKRAVPDTKNRTMSLEELREEFLSNVSHEFRSPFSAVKGYMDLMIMQKDTLSPKHQEYLGLMRQGMDRLGRFIDNVMDLTVLNSGLVQLTMEPLDVHELFEETIRRNQATLAYDRIAPIIECPEGACVTADRDKMIQVLQHLLSNAMKFTPEGGTVTLWAKDGKDGLVMGITDTGIGIPKDRWEDVFKKFEQVLEDRHRVRKTTGTGLGLTLVRGWIEAQGGRVWIDNSTPHGTTIAWCLPARKAMPARHHARKAA